MDSMEHNEGFENLDEEDLTKGTQEAEPELPDKYRGKSAAEIVKMHQEAEKVISRQGQEVSEVRRLADELIRRNFQSAQQPAPQTEALSDLDDVDFFADPKAAIARAVANHPSVKNAEMTAAQLARQASLRTLETQHPDYKQVVAQPEFQEWVQKSKVRQQLFQAADRYDYDAADELLSTFKELRAIKKAEVEDQVAELKDKQRESLRAASNPAVGGSSEPTGKKIYRRADLIQLQIRDPHRYESLQNEIMQAYAEGRVR